jgi:uncharacterized protein
MLVRVEVECVRVERSQPQGEGMMLTPDDRTCVMLKGDRGMRTINIEIGPTEAFAIASALDGQEFQRPMTLDLLAHVLAGLRADLREAVITEQREGVYLAELNFIAADGLPIAVSARPSDAIALALCVNAPILVNESLLADAA